MNIQQTYDPPRPDLDAGDLVAYTDKFLRHCRHVKFSDGETRECHADNVCRVKLACASCGSPYHPSTGHVLSRKSVQCGPCARSFARWLSGHLKRKWSGSSFYEEAVTSIRPDF